jgi:hypothetical protein
VRCDLECTRILPYEQNASLRRTAARLGKVF